VARLDLKYHPGHSSILLLMLVRGARFLMLSNISEVYHPRILFKTGSRLLFWNEYSHPRGRLSHTYYGFPEHRSDPSVGQKASEPIRALHFSGLRVTPSRFPAKKCDWPIEGSDRCLARCTQQSWEPPASTRAPR